MDALSRKARQLLNVPQIREALHTVVATGIAQQVTIPDENDLTLQQQSAASASDAAVVIRSVTIRSLSRG